MTNPDNRILYIEDDEPLCDLFKVAVEAHGYSVDVALSGEDGLALHATQPYDLIATDHQLPNMTGIDIARKLLIDNPNIPIVMVTGRGSEQIAAEALALGVYNYVIKDSEKVYLELLPNIIDSALKRSAEHRDQIGITKHLEDAMEGISEGILYFDADDRLVLVNDRLREMYPLAADVFVPGVSYEECMRLGVESGQWGPQDGEDKEEWIQSRLTYHYDPKGSFEFNLSDGRSIRIEEKKTPQGGVVGIRADITEVKEIEAQVRESEERLRGIMDTAVDGIITINSRGVVNSFNQAAQDIFGYTEEEIIGKNVKALMQESDARQHDTFVNNYVQSGRAKILGIGREVVGQRKDGSTFPMDLDVSELRLGDRIYFTGIVRDITRRKKAQEEIKKLNKKLELRVEERTKELTTSETKYHQLMDSIPQKIFFKDKDSIYVLANPSFASDFNLKPEDIVGKNDFDLYPKDLAEKYRADDRRILENGKPINIDEFAIICGDEKIVNTLKSPVRNDDGNIIGVFGIFWDITDKKQAYEAMVAAKQEAERATHAKSQFLAAVSHELRTPLNAILGFAQVMQGQYFGPIGEKKYLNYAEDIASSGEHLLSLVDDLLDISTIEAGKKYLEKEKLSTNEIVTECVKLVAEKAKNGGINLAMNAPEGLPPLYVDYRAIKQILLNLLSNANKFTPKGGYIKVTAKATKKNTIIKVADTGKGIPPEKLPELTNMFIRAEGDPYVAEKGWGLGLSITKSLVDLHGGTLDIKSKIGKGTIVTVTIPNSAP